MHADPWVHVQCERREDNRQVMGKGAKAAGVNETRHKTCTAGASQPILGCEAMFAYKVRELNCVATSAYRDTKDWGARRAEREEEGRQSQSVSETHKHREADMEKGINWVNTQTCGVKREKIRAAAHVSA
jgi:hypothetical protein